MRNLFLLQMNLKSAKVTVSLIFIHFPEIVHIPVSWLAGVGGSSSNDATNKHCSVNNALTYYLVNQFSLHYHQSYHSLHIQQQSAINLVDVKKSDLV